MTQINKTIKKNKNHNIRDITLSGRIGKLVASHAEGCKVERSNPGSG